MTLCEKCQDPDPKAHEAIMYSCECEKGLGKIKGGGKWYCPKCPEVKREIKILKPRRKVKK